VRATVVYGVLLVVFIIFLPKGMSEMTFLRIVIPLYLFV
jgi:hypothetical protein